MNSSKNGNEVVLEPVSGRLGETGHRRWGFALCAGVIALAVGVTVDATMAAATGKVVRATGAPAGTITDYVGTGISSPLGITVGSDGALWFTNYGNNSIGRITTLGSFTDFANPAINGPRSITSGSDKALWFTNYNTNTIGRIPTSGLGVTDYTGNLISNPPSLALGPDKAIWFTNYGNNSIGRITTTGVVTNHIGLGISNPGYNGQGITKGPDGAMWFTNSGNGSIGRITTSGTVTNYPSTSISDPTSITVGPDGALWFTNDGTNTIGRITTGATPVITSFLEGSCVPVPPSTSCIDDPQGITTGSDGALWFTNYSNNTIGRITTSGTVTNYTAASVSDPWGMTAGPDGALWFTNYGNNSIGRITTSVTPACTSFSPGSGTAGTSVTITGVNLGTASAVRFNGSSALIASKSATQVKTSVPTGASSGHITVTTPAGTATCSKVFTVKA